MNKIKNLREELNLTQQELADKLNCSKSVIGLYENEFRKPSLEILVKLSEIFDCSIDYLLGKTNIKKPKEVNINEADVAFVNGIEGLNETNKMIIKNTLEALLAKQEKDDKENK
jgi:transcriptional regulator with XRE-family HTH domain